MHAMCEVKRCVLLAANPETHSCPFEALHSHSSFDPLAASWSALRSLFLFLAPRMKLSIDNFQPVQSHVRIDLAGGDIGMAQDRLDGAQVCSIFHHMRGAAMAQHMRAGMAAGSGSVFYYFPHALPCQPSASTAHKKHC